MRNHGRILALLGVLAFGAAAQSLCLFSMQVVHADEWRTEADALGARFHTIPFRRGSILDRNGTPIAVDEESFALDFEYGAFRAKHPVGQTSFILSTLDGRLVSLKETAASTRAAAESICNISPSKIAALWQRGERGAVRSALVALIQMSREETSQFSRALSERDRRPLDALVPGLFQRVKSRLDAGCESLAMLDAKLGHAAGTTLAMIDDKRVRVLQDVEAAIARMRDGDSVSALDGDEVAEERTSRRKQREAWLERFETDVTYDAAELIAARPDRLPGFVVSDSMTRRYREPLLPRFIGGVARPNEAELDAAERDRERLAELTRRMSTTDAEQEEIRDLRRRLREDRYTPGDVVGRGGIESQYEEMLRGSRGWRLEMIGRHGGEEMRVQSKSPENGRDVTLTIDLNLQAACERILRDGVPALPGQTIRGAMVVVDIPTGDVLALAAAPGYTRDDLKDPARWEQIKRVDDDPRSRAKPLSHRAFHPYYPPNPGSVFKVVTAVAALEAGIITPSTTHNCAGSIGTLKCEARHGDLDLRAALEHSCNVYFGWLGERLGRKALQDASRRFGFGSATGFSPIEVAGSLELQSEDVELLRRFGIGYTLTVTPLQVARLYAAIADGGRLRRLRSVRAVGNFEIELRAPSPLNVSPENLQILQEALRGVVTRGTARDAGLDVLGAAGKTGTAEVDSKGVDNHAWFAGYAPFDAPRVAFAFYIERVPIHGKDAAPLARALLASPAMKPYLRP